MYNFTKFIPKFVDLGLPSGLLWAECNVGAITETESGKYFQWGDTEGRYADEAKKKPCNWDTTPWGVSKPTMQTLDAEHDAATAAYGEGYRMPTKYEIQELFDNTINEWIKNYKGRGVNGMLFTSTKNNNSIFIPAAGYCDNSIVYRVGSDGYVWPSSIWYSYYAYTFLFVNGNINPHSSFGRCHGLSVRAVTSMKFK